MGAGLSSFLLLPGRGCLLLLLPRLRISAAGSAYVFSYSVGIRLPIQYSTFGFSGCLFAARWDVSVLFGRIPRPRSWVFAIPFSAATIILMFILLLFGISTSGLLDKPYGRPEGCLRYFRMHSSTMTGRRSPMGEFIYGFLSYFCPGWGFCRRPVQSRRRWVSSWLSYRIIRLRMSAAGSIYVFSYSVGFRLSFQRSNYYCYFYYYFRPREFANSPLHVSPFGLQIILGASRDRWQKR